MLIEHTNQNKQPPVFLDPARKKPGEFMRGLYHFIRGSAPDRSCINPAKAASGSAPAGIGHLCQCECNIYGHGREKLNLITNPPNTGLTRRPREAAPEDRERGLVHAGRRGEGLGAVAAGHHVPGYCVIDQPSISQLYLAPLMSSCFWRRVPCLLPGPVPAHLEGAEASALAVALAVRVVVGGGVVACVCVIARGCSQ